MCVGSFKTSVFALGLHVVLHGVLSLESHLLEVVVFVVVVILGVHSLEGVHVGVVEEMRILLLQISLHLI